MYRTTIRASARAVSAGLLATCLAAACETGANDGQSPATEADIIAEATTFMSTYARDLLAGDRAAIGARYDPDGAYIVGNGSKALVPHDSIVALYMGKWTPPASFEWQDLSYEPIGNDAVVVVGRFTWGAAGAAAPLNVSYTSLLRRRDGELRIRVEDESVDPASMRTPAPPAPDTAR
jgi:hypothetical protein